ncbi:L-cystine transporter [Thalassobacillus sp. CUG 92003]|uniref:L-cystine transporter n=1 Tax=Thalassobacillus sp. CUG 92003 TaxID=2736641 RepID=UPI0015E74E28|nr:L-cystine transporter [Thalassobacillus sp. CUG 92003]
MEHVAIIINIILFLAFIFLLFRLQRKNVSFSKRVFSGLGLGVLLGIYLQWWFGAQSDVVTTTTDWYSIVGSGYVRLLMMIVIPLVMVSIIQAIINLAKSSELGKMSGWILSILVGTAMIAAVVGIACTLIFDLNADQIEAGQAEADRGAYLEERVGEVEDLSIPQQILSFIPRNPFEDMTGARSTSTIAVVIFSVFIGLAILAVRRKQPDHAAMVTKGVNAIYAVVMRIVTMVLRLTPFGIMALIANTVARTELAGILELGKFVLVSYIALFVMFLIHLLFIFLAGLNPWRYVQKVLPVLGFAFTSRSSAGTIPLNIQAQKSSLGVDEGSANMSASFGATIGQNGCAGIYPAMLAVMIAPTVGIDPLSPGFILQLILIVGIGSFGVAGVGGGATFAALIVLSSMNLPVYLAGLLISVEPLIDMGRTALNVNGAMTSGTLTSRFLGKLDRQTFQNPDAIEKDLTL